MSEFTPISALAGGALIGLSATLLMAANGHIAGISGILGGFLLGPMPDRAWRGAFLVGLVAGPLAFAALGGATPFKAPGPLALAVLGGLAVGFGTRLGGGCTSGHGVCGVARLSRRSIAATLTFMLVGVATLALVRHGLGIGA